ncbi:MAG: NfeD family protein [Burkholderiales bacterium]|nr:NfeD family protein [Burkholderiales bacterium]
MHLLSDLLWWHWIVLGIVLMLLELAVPAFFLIWFGAAATVVGLLLAVFPGIPLAWQVIVWIAGSVVLIWLWFRIFKRGYYRTRAGMSKGSLVGEVGLVTKNIRPYEKGQIRLQKPVLGDDLWEALADEEYRVGDRVRILDIEGNMVKVTRA